MSLHGTSLVPLYTDHILKKRKNNCKCHVAGESNSLTFSFFFFKLPVYLCMSAARWSSSFEAGLVFLCVNVESVRMRYSVVLKFDIQALVTRSYRCWVFELACKLIWLTFKSLASVVAHLNFLCDCLAKQ